MQKQYTPIHFECREYNDAAVTNVAAVAVVYNGVLAVIILISAFAVVNFAEATLIYIAAVAVIKVADVTDYLP